MCSEIPHCAKRQNVADNYNINKIPFTLPKFELHEDSYNINFTINELQEILSMDKSGLIIFMGDPGTGKSYLIKHLVKSVKKDFVYVTQDMVQYLFEPRNMSFVIQNLKENILIFEDSENLFIDRKMRSNNIISTLLNVCDGIMGDLFKIKILATINVKENIDTALFRKGRLLAEVNFGRLSIDMCNKVLERIGSDIRVNKEHTLAELYNYNNYNGHKEFNGKIGFNLLE